MQIPIPPAEDDQARRARDMERAAREQAAARSAEATTIGEGGLVVKNGGSIRVESPGTIDLPGGSFSANSVSAATTVTAGGTVQGGAIVSTGNASVAGTASVGALSSAGNVSGQRGTFPTGVSSTGVYNTLLTYGGPYSSQYVHQDGTMGYVPSSARYKQDIMSATLDPATLRQLRVVTFRYIAAVENLGDEAAVEIGLIAEEVDALGLAWLVDYDSEGLPMGVRYDRLALALIPWMASIESRLAALEV